MRVNALLATFMLLIVMFSTAQINDFKTQEVEDNPFLSASIKNSTISKTVNPNLGSTDGGEEITITGTGFLDMAYKNVTHDGEAYTWTTSTVNYVTSSGWDPSIGVDSNGTVHIVHVILDSDELWHSTYDGSTWSHAKIRNCDCRNIDLVIDSNDNVHIAHYNNGYLLYSMYDGTSWTNNWSKSNVENDQISIALDANDRPHISYSRDGYICNAALLSYHDGSSWTTVTLDDTSTYIGCDSSIAIDSNGFVHVAYRHHGNMDMLIASNISGTWQRYSVDNGNGVGYHSAMAVDSNDELHLVYASNAAGNTAYFADGASGSAWVVSNQGNSRDTFSMYIDQFDIVHISEYNGGSNLGYSMVAPGTSRQSMTVDNVGDVGYGNDIVVDDNNMVHIAYYDTTNKNLKYANRSTGMIQTHEVRVDFGSYGSVIGTVVNDTTIVLTTPGHTSEQFSATAGTVTPSIWDVDGVEHQINNAFRFYLPDDFDSDGINDEYDDCPLVAGPVTNDAVGCPDADSDGYSDGVDVFPNDATQWLDTDGDGYGDNSNENNGDAFPLDSSQWDDVDLDGYGDNPFGNQSDDCPSVAGNSTLDALGCPDDDGDGVSNMSDAFPFNALEHLDSDDDGVGDNSDMYPLDATESMDSDGDGVGDNADAFPNDSTETMDSDGDGIGDNSDSHPFIDNNLDADADGYLNTVDAFPDDSTQWNDTDADGYGDNPLGNNSDAFLNEPTQWVDTDGDGYGDNWGNSSWNTSRLFIWPGQFVDGALLADHCPLEFGNSTGDGFYGCLDDDGDGIANIYDQTPQGEMNDSNSTNTNDSDSDGVLDSEDACPNSALGTYVDDVGCIIDSDGDGIDDLTDICPNTTLGAQVTVEGCELSIQGDEEEQSFIDSLLSGGSDSVRTTVGFGAIMVAFFALLQTNFVAAMLPDAFRWMQVLRRSNQLSKEERGELTYLQSLVQAYYADMPALAEELLQLNADLTARYTNNEITKETREKLNTLIEGLLSTSPEQMERIAYNDAYFGLIGTTDAAERTELLQQELAMRDVPEETVNEVKRESDDNAPATSMQGNVNSEDGHEYLEHPAGSGVWFVRDRDSGNWKKWV